MRLLIAEDDPLLARSVTQGLREEGFAVDHAVSGDAALHLAESNPYDAIVLDLMLPVVDGWTVLRQLRGQKSLTPILCLTALDSVDDRVQGLELGCDDYLVKPFAWRELVARIRAVIRRGHGKSTTIISVHDLEIDCARKVVHRGGRRVDLSAKEFSLLEYLAHRADCVVTRTELWDHLYDRNDQNTSNVVDVFIAYLRGKIDRDYPVKLIHTRRGQGYILTANP